ncbi:hypothetical protein PG996_000020 [Apiospora saccharicola]|uniref:Uncharacterized protein n=1 Tax=Apiospora saccharicola TaxID=335842 RepID=A0ABR1WCJ8_9PEZI
MAASVTGSLQWGQTEDSHWIVKASWFGSLLLSLFSVITALHLSILMGTVEIPRDGIKGLVSRAANSTGETPNKMGVFLLQSPILLLSYSIMSYIAGLTIMVVGKLWQGSSGDDQKIAAFFIQTAPPEKLLDGLDRIVL